jgi:hypothetical protein
MSGMRLRLCFSCGVATLNQSFPVDDECPMDSPQARERWRRRYAQAVQRLRDEGIATRTDPGAGAREYVELRASWQPGIEALAPALGYRKEEVDSSNAA